MSVCAIVTIAAIVIIFISLLMLLLSMDSIPPIHYGITYNKLSKSVSEEVYENGRYLIGPLTSFVIYPGYLVNIEFSNSRKADVSQYLNLLILYKLYLHE